MKVPLFLPDELGQPIKPKVLPPAESVKFKGGTRTRGGDVTFPDYILTENLLISSKKVDDFTRQWRSKYDFHLANFQVDINPNPEYQTEWVTIHCNFNPLTAPKHRPIAKYIFPSTEFVDKNWKVSGKFGVSASLGFDKLPSFLNKFVEGAFEGEAKIEFEYKPRLARIDSGTTGSNFHWNFRSTKGESPVGGLNLIILIMRPRSVKKMKIYFEILVKFNLRNVPLIGNDMPRAFGDSIVEFNPGPI